MRPPGFQEKAFVNQSTKALQESLDGDRVVAVVVIYQGGLDLRQARALGRCLDESGVLFIQVPAAGLQLIAVNEDDRWTSLDRKGNLLIALVLQITNINDRPSRSNDRRPRVQYQR